jgi:hypothetical protein
MKIELYAEGAN